ncbi:MAG: NAD(P)-binding protein [Piscirickettsiaceae bacterium]|nr:NAD(P)-binding protein [Piscirickettsiaceae bacterium]
MTNIAIIGAGLSGLTAATKLNQHANITVFEKAGGVGGRMATRHAAPYSFDHGAQFFLARTAEFKAFISPMLTQGIIAPWDGCFAEFENKKIILKRQWVEDKPHYVGVPGMNAIAKYLSRDLNVRLDVKVQSITKKNDKWQLDDDQGKTLGEYDWVIPTTPAQQASELLPSSLSCYPKLDEIKMKACFSLMLGFEHDLSLAFDAALVRGNDISWISVNSTKPGRGKPFCLLVHSTNQWADDHLYDGSDQVMEYLSSQTSEVIGFDLSGAAHKSLHGWHFANIGKQTGETHFLDMEQQIAVCGDWFIQGRVEAAFTSGFDAATKLIRAL